MKNLYLGKQIIFAKLCLIVLLCSYSKLYGQATQEHSGAIFTGNALYYSAQNAGMNSLTGTLTISADAKSSGSATVTTTGPVSVTVIPSDLSHAGPENRTDPPISKTWTGTVTVDAATAPVSGTSATAQIKGNATITYSVPGTGVGQWNVGTADSPQWHHYENYTHTESVDLTVYSILDSISGPDTVCSGTTATYSVTTYPSTGGSVAWSNGSTNNSVSIVINSDITLTCKFTIEGVSYTATKQIYLKPLGPPVAVGVTFPGVSEVIAEGDNLKTLAGNALTYLPASITVTGPTVTFTATGQDCCKNDSIIATGKTTATLTVEASISAENIPLLPPPLTGSYSRNFTFFGASLLLEADYGLFIDASVELTGSGTATINKCVVPDFCYDASLGIAVPVTIHATIGGSICLQNPGGTTTQCDHEDPATGTDCTNMTANFCGYCSEHTGEHPFWCGLICPGLSLDVATLSTSFYGNIGYTTCTSPNFKANVGMEKVELTFLQVTIGSSTFGPPAFEVWHGGDFYSTP